MIRVRIYRDMLSRDVFREIGIELPALVAGAARRGVSTAACLASVVAAEMAADGAPREALVLVINGRSHRVDAKAAAGLDGVDVREGDEVWAAPAPAGAELLVSLAVGLALSVAGTLITNALVKPPRAASVTQEQPERRLGFSRYQSTVVEGDVIPVVLGRRMKYGGKEINAYSIESPDGSGAETLLMLLLLGHGPFQEIAGFTSAVTGVDAATASGLYLNDQPIGNFPGCRVSVRMGTSGQAAIPGWEDTVRRREVGSGGVVLRNTSGAERTGSSPSSEAFTMSVGPLNAVTARVALRKGLFSVVGNNSQAVARRVKYRYRHRPTSGAWSAWTVVTVEQMRQSSFYSSPMFEVLGGGSAGAGTCEVQLERVSAESASAADVDDLAWEEVVERTDSNNTYPGMALVALELTASEQLQSKPRVSVDVKGYKSCRVWDGVSSPTSPVFVREYTENPAWHAMEWLTNATWGMGAQTTDADVAMSTFIQAGVYNDEQVRRRPGPAGEDRGTRPRFAASFVVDEARPAVEHLRTIARSFRGVPVTRGQTWAMWQDRPQASPVERFTDATLLRGNENGSSAELEYRRQHTRDGFAVANQVVVQYEAQDRVGDVDATADGDARTEIFPRAGEYWLDAAGLNEPVRSESLRLDGVFDPDQAHDEAVYLAKSRRFRTRSVRFKTTKHVIECQPGDRIDVAFSLVNWGVASGRCMQGSTTGFVAIDAAVYLDSGKRYVLTLTAKDGSVVEAMVPEGTGGTYGAFRPLPVSAPLPAAPEELSEWSLGVEGVQMKPFICTGASLVDLDTLTWEVAGLEYAAGVYDPEVVNVVIPSYGGEPGALVPPGPVRSISIADRGVVGAGGGGASAFRRLELSWSQFPEDAARTATFRVYWKREGSNAWIAVPTAYQRVSLRGAVVDLAETDAAYTFVAVAVSFMGSALSPADPRHPRASIALGLGIGYPPPPTGVAAVQLASNTYELRWTAPATPQPDNTPYSYIVISPGKDPSSLGDGAAKHSMILGRTTETTFGPLELPPNQPVELMVRSVNSSGRMSKTAPRASVTGPVPGGQSVKSSVEWTPASSGLTLTNASTVTVDGASAWAPTDPALAAVVEFPWVDTGTATAGELTLCPACKSAAGDPVALDFKIRVPSVAADQFVAKASGTNPPVLLLDMPPRPDGAHTWEYEVRTDDGVVVTDYAPLAAFAAVNRTIKRYRVRATLRRGGAYVPPGHQYRPGLASLRAVLTH